MRLMWLFVACYAPSPYCNASVSQANAVSDKLLDLRSCVYIGKNLADKVLSGALVADADFSNTVMTNVTMTKSYAKGSNFSGMHAFTTHLGLLLLHCREAFMLINKERLPKAVCLDLQVLT